MKAAWEGGSEGGWGAAGSAEVEGSPSSSSEALSRLGLPLELVEGHVERVLLDVVPERHADHHGPRSVLVAPALGGLADVVVGAEHDPVALPLEDGFVDREVDGLLGGLLGGLVDRVGGGLEDLLVVGGRLLAGREDEGGGEQDGERTHGGSPPGGVKVDGHGTGE